MINSAGKDGLFAGGGLEVLLVQVEAVLITIVVSAVVTFALAQVVNATMGLRVAEEEEAEGLDLSQHGEVGYGR